MICTFRSIFPTDMGECFAKTLYRGGFMNPPWAFARLHTQICTLRSFFLQIWGCYVKPLGALRGFAKPLHIWCLTKSPGDLKASQRPYTKEALQASKGLLHTFWSFLTDIGSFVKPREAFRSFGGHHTHLHMHICAFQYFFLQIWGVLCKAPRSFE